MSELRRKGYFTNEIVNVGEVMHMCHRSQALETLCATYHMAIVGLTLLVDKTKTRMQPHPILIVNADQDEVAWGAVTLAYLYRQLGMGLVLVARPLSVVLHCSKLGYTSTFRPFAPILVELMCLTRLGWRCGPRKS